MSSTLERINAFYAKYPTLQPDETHLLFCDFLDGILSTGTTFQPSEIAIQLQNMQHILSSIPTKINNDTQASLRDHTTTLVEKMIFQLQNFMTRNQEIVQKQLDGINKDLKLFLIDDLAKLQKGNVSTEDFTKNLTQHIQQIMGDVVAQSEMRLTHNVQRLQDITVESKTQNEAVNIKVSDLCSKMDKAVNKGKAGENMLVSILNNLIPRTTIEVVTKQKESGDVFLQTEDMPKILIETKFFETPVGEKEVVKFIRDVRIHDCCGLMLSHTSPISCKNNFEINIENGNVLLYMHNVNYDQALIKQGISTIHYLKKRLDDYNTVKDGEGFTVPKLLMDSINSEYGKLVRDIKVIHDEVKSTSGTIIEKLNKLCIQSLEMYLEKHYAFSRSQDILCEYCGESFQSTYSRGSHLRNNCEIYLQLQGQENRKKPGRPVKENLEGNTKIKKQKLANEIVL